MLSAISLDPYFNIFMNIDFSATKRDKVVMEVLFFGLARMSRKE